MYSWIAGHAKRLWAQGGAGRVLAVLVIAGGAVGIGALKVGLRTAAVRTVTGCGIDEAGMNKRASAMIEALEQKHGKGKPGPPGYSRVDFEKFDVDYVDMNDPCHSFMSVRTLISSTPPVPPAQMMRALEDHQIGGRYEKGLGGSFVYDEEKTTFRIVYIVELKTQTPASFVRTVDEYLNVADSWRNGWFEEVALVVRGEARPPDKPVYRPGKDPESILRGVDAFLKDAGQEGIY